MVRNKITPFKRHYAGLRQVFKFNDQTFLALFCHPLDVHTVRTWVFFTIVLLWDLVQAKIYKFEIRKRGLVVKLGNFDERNLFAPVLLYSTLWLVSKTHTAFSDNERSNQNQSWLASMYFPALGARCINLLQSLIGPKRFWRLFWFTRATNSV